MKTVFAFVNDKLNCLRNRKLFLAIRRVFNILIIKQIAAAAFFFLASATTLFSQSNTQVTLTSGTTWTSPAGVTNITVECWGGGGAGGGVSVNNNGGGGGAGGAYATSILTISPSTVYSISVGAGGTGVRDWQAIRERTLGLIQFQQ